MAQQEISDRSSDNPRSTSNTQSSSSDFTFSGKPRVMKLDLLTLPQFNVTYITRCLSVSERLTVFAHVHRRFYDFVLQPQCFPDMSFFPVDTTERAPKIISANGNAGITYVEINIFSNHPFVQRVSLFAGMWNFNANLWNEMDWPVRKNIESLQLTLDYKSNQSDIYLDEPPRLSMSHLPQSSSMMSRYPPQRSSDDDNDSDENKASAHSLKLSPTDSGEEQKWYDFEQCISPTTRKPIELKSRVRNLFFIKVDSNPQQQTIYFPKTLWGLGLQSFGSAIFASSWWSKQIEIEVRIWIHFVVDEQFDKIYINSNDLSR